MAANTATVTVAITTASESAFARELLALVDRHHVAVSAQMTALSRQHDVILELLSRSTATIGSTLRQDLEVGLKHVLAQLAGGMVALSSGQKELPDVDP